MKLTKRSTGLIGLVMCCASVNTQAQVFARGAVNANSATPTVNEQFRVTNGLLSHSVSGNVGGGAAGDKWIGIGDPFQTVPPPNPNNLLYGFRTQWNQKALIINLKGITSGGSQVPTEAEFQWGGPASPNWTGSLNFNYIDNFTSNTPLYRVLELTSGGNTISRTGLLGHSRAGVFGGFGSGDQWIGIGQPTNNGLPTGTLLPFYGTRVQWGGNSLLTNIRNSGSSFIPSIDWKSGSLFNESLEFRHFTNPADPASFTRILDLSPSGIVRVGPTYSSVLGAVTNQFQVYNTNGRSNIYLRTEGAGTGSFVSNLDGQAFGGTGLFSQAYGLTGAAYNSQNCYGVQGRAFSPTGFGYGVQGQIFSASTGTNYAVYGEIVSATGGNNWAGYFAGRVFANQYVSSSDAQLKKDIKDEDASVLTRLKQLRPVNYTYRSNEKNFENMGLPEGLRHGFLAQEVEKVFPELVTAIQQPKLSAEDAENRKSSQESIQFKGIDYNGMISLLTKAIQEQQAQIEKLETKLAAATGGEVLMVQEKQKTVADAVRNQAFMLAQNQPNPFTATTVIRYTVPAGATNAMIGVFDLNGKMLMQYRLEPGTSQVTINGNTLQAGMYLYTLLVNGEEVVTKKMVLTK